MAIEDINPRADTHLLVIPERHVDTFREVSLFSADESLRMLEFVADTARGAGLEDYRVVVNVGRGGGQTVFHLHWHILGGRLRGLLASLRSAEKELQRPLSDQEELQVLQRERKRRIEAADAFRSGGRPEQAEAEERELAVLQEFMPEPLAEDELEEIVDDAIAETGATSMRDFGRVMADVMPQISGRADGSMVSQLVKEKLA